MKIKINLIDWLYQNYGPQDVENFLYSYTRMYLERADRLPVYQTLTQAQFIIHNTILEGTEPKIDPDSYLYKKWNGIDEEWSRYVYSLYQETKAKCKPSESGNIVFNIRVVPSEQVPDTLTIYIKEWLSNFFKGTIDEEGLNSIYVDNIWHHMDLKGIMHTELDTTACLVEGKFSSELLFVNISLDSKSQYSKLNDTWRRYVENRAREGYTKFNIIWEPNNIKRTPHIQTIDVYAWIVQNFDIEIKGEFVKRFLELYGRKQFKKIAKTYRTVSEVKNFFINLGLDKGIWKEVSLKWQGLINEPYIENSVPIQYNLIWNSTSMETNYCTSVPLEKKEKGIQMRKIKIPLTQEERTIRAIQRRIFDQDISKKTIVKYYDADRQFLIEKIEQFAREFEESGEEYPINIKVQHYMSDENSDLDTWDTKQLLDFYKVLDDGPIDHYWVTEEARAAYFKWIQGGSKKADLFKSNKYKIVFNAATLTLSMRYRNSLAPDKYIWTLSLGDILGSKNEF